MKKSRKYINLWLFIIIVILSLSTACGIMGYDINAHVSSQTWSLHRSTMNLSYSCDEKISGSGNFSRLSRLQGLAGHMKDESSYSLNGSLDHNERLRFLTREGTVTINANIHEYVLSPNNKSELEDLTGDSAYIVADERWPSSFIDFKSIKYSGSGIRTRDAYYSDGDKVSTSFYSSTLHKESLYRVAINRTVIRAIITPDTVIEDRNMNRTSTFVLNSISEGPLTNIKFSRSRPYTETNDFGRMNPSILISEDYAGKQNISLKIQTNESVITPSGDYNDELPCCYGVNQSLPDMQDVFDCSCLKKFRGVVG